MTIEEIALGFGFTVVRPAEFDGFRYIGAKAKDVELAPLPHEMLHWLSPQIAFPSEERTIEVGTALATKFLEAARQLGHNVCVVRADLATNRYRDFERGIDGWGLRGRFTTWKAEVNESLTTANRPQPSGQG